MKRRLPIGIQDFVTIREDGFCYVDKTKRIHDLLTGSGKSFFLSRPRRFGKSLLCSTLGAIFEGRRELFTGLAIDSLEWDWKKHPVIRIDLNPGNYGQGVDVLFENCNRSLEFAAQKFHVSLTGDSSGDSFIRLIKALNDRYGEKVAVIIDEYDKPLLNTMDDRDLHVAIRNELEGFYGVLKSTDEHLKFVFLTGVTKFSQVSVFSDLNHLTDLTLNPCYADLCGITQEELERDFAPEIEDVARTTGRDRETYLEDLRRFYNGYRFSEKPLTVYNPFDLLNHFFQEGKFLPYWFETGTPTFLIKLIENQNIDIAGLEKETVYYDDLRKYDVADMQAVPVLYQSGYLTISGYDEELQAYSLDYPNEEVRGGFAKSLMEKYLKAPDQDLRALASALPRALYQGDIEGAMNALPPFFASIPYDIQIKQEKYFQTVVHLIFRMLGLHCQSEVKTAAGRIDTLAQTKRYVYCFEFKLGGGAGSKSSETLAEEALRQIDSKEYLLPWTGSGKTLIKVGVAFDSEKRNIGAWKTG
ncbi:MAG: ATP-binding protein [Spirochaetales bacterium]|jgi:hypothetical protein|nr:ATP-binding protein [Spirochaetales bacterium]